MNRDQALAALTTATGWRKSSYSQGQNGCVEVTTDWGGWVGVRDSKLGPRSPVLAVATAGWHAVLAGVHAGELT
ncbi:MAG: DUF397 domain-containing protein [Pseudonocardiaceae bacterium]